MTTRSTTTPPTSSAAPARPAPATAASRPASTTRSTRPSRARTPRRLPPPTHRRSRSTPSPTPAIPVARASTTSSSGSRFRAATATTTSSRPTRTIRAAASPTRRRRGRGATPSQPSPAPKPAPDWNDRGGGSPSPPLAGQGTYRFYTIAVDKAGNREDPPAVADDVTVVSSTVYDTTKPSVTINQAAGQADPTNGSPIDYTATFSEPVTGFSGSDVTLSGTAGATSTVVSEVAPNDGTTYNVAVSGMTSDGTVIASVPADSAADAATNGNNASSSSDHTVTYDTTAPSVSSITRSDPDPTNASSVSWTVTFSEHVAGVDTSDFPPADGGSLSGSSVSTVSAASGVVFTVTADTGSGDGTLRLDVADDDSIHDDATNKLGGTGTTGAGDGSFTTGEHYTVDKTKPSSHASSPAATNASPFTVNSVPDASDTGGAGFHHLELWVKVPGGDGNYHKFATDSNDPSGGFSYTPLAGQGPY